MVAVELLLPAAAEDGVLVAELRVLVNRAYEVAEEGMRHGGVARTTDAEVSDAIRDGEVLVATDIGRVVGSIRTRLLNEGTGWVGVLAGRGREGAGDRRGALWGRPAA